MFADLLGSFAAMRRPPGCEVVFLFAENDSDFTVLPQVRAFRDAVREPVQLELEPRPGIPMARNRVLDMALAADADILTFVDDDEIVTDDWLVHLVAGMEARKLDLGGGPVRLTKTAEPMSKWNTAIYRHLIYRSRKRNTERAASVADATDHLNNIYTNNWALRLASQRRFGIRFDEGLQVSGGSDTQFSLDMNRAGARIGWIPDAWVEEPTPVKRLTLRYHYRRARDQSTNAVLLARKGAPRALWQAFARTLDATLFMVAAPVLGRYMVAKAAHKIGIAAGCVRGALGGRSRHYAPGSAQFHVEAES
jgi:glycosyltransferase involved in cell wall biosynthesis